jgi:hypothetical protein
MPYSGGSSAYLPFGGGGFVPYSSGPGGGLGVMPRMTQSRMPGPGTPMNGMAGLGGSSLGRPRSAIVPLAPIVRGGAGMAGSMGGSPLILRSSVLGGMGGMTRPPVGNYPFRQPPSLIGPATATTGMSM